MIKVALIIVASAAFGWFGCGLVQWALCPRTDFPWRRISLLSENSCEVEIRPGQWVTPAKATAFKELCQ